MICIIHTLFILFFAFIYLNSDIKSLLLVIWYSAASSLACFRFLLLLLQPYHFVLFLLWSFNNCWVCSFYLHFFVFLVFWGCLCLCFSLFALYGLLLVFGKIRLCGHVFGLSFLILFIFLFNFFNFIAVNLSFERILVSVKVRVHTNLNNIEKKGF